MERRLVVLALIGLLLACAPETDRRHYAVGETGTAIFHNRSDWTLYLGGCGHFDLERRIGDEWIVQPPVQLCFWEGFAEPVPPGAVVRDEFEAREPGTWRLRYPVGLGCSTSAPLDEASCRAVVDVASNEFTVEKNGCAVGGCSGQVCGERGVVDQLVTTCEWRAEYACYRSARCGRFGPGGTCAWEPTLELLACLAEPGPDGQ